MKELQITAWCDVCWQSGEARSPSVQMMPMAVGNAPSHRPAWKELEFCAEHAPAALAMLAIFEAAPSEPTAPSQPLRKARRSDDDGNECPICGKLYSAPNTTVHHIMAVHRPGESLYPPDNRCEICGDQFSGAQGLASHTKGKHGLDPIERAAAPVLARERLKRERASA